MSMVVAFYIRTDKGYIPVYNQVQGAYNKEEFETFTAFNSQYNPRVVDMGGITYNLEGGGKIVTRWVPGSGVFADCYFDVYNANNEKLVTWGATYRTDRNLDGFVILVTDGERIAEGSSGDLSVGLAKTVQPGIPGMKPTAYCNTTWNTKTWGFSYPLNIDAIKDAIVQPDEIDPYDPGGNTDPGGGDGDFDDTSDPIEFSPDPIISAVDTGFITLFNPSLAQLNNLANYMWGSLFDLENFKKLFANPMDAILGLSIVPVSVPNGGTSNVRVGNIDTGVSMTKAGSQYVNVDCGTLNIKEYWGAYLDYSPYTKAEIFLPFIGTHPLDIDDIMKKAVHVKYKVDILSGACIAQIKCGDAVLYSYAGQCAATIPITGRDWTNVVGSALSIVGNVAGAAVTGGMLAPMAAANVAQAVTNMGKPNIQKSGSVAGMAGIMGIQKPYIMLTRPRQAVPKRQNHYTGYPSFITEKLSKCSGYTEVEAVHLEGVPGTTEEMEEIERLLKSGVIF